jgi:predicted enzyme related to lactoylglutathione lyase
MRAKYVHTNIIAEDWRSLAAFYATVFGCTRVPPERDYAGDTFDAGTGLKGAHLRGAHLRLPGYGDDGPTIEIYSYDLHEARPAVAINRPGFGHIAFEVADVAQAHAEILAHGGAAVGEIVTLSPQAGMHVTWCYMTDPEGNVIEIQSWSH